MKGLRCRWCQKDVRVNADGTLRKHKRARATSWSRRPADLCNGSGKHWQDHRPEFRRNDASL